MIAFGRRQFQRPYLPPTLKPPAPSSATETAATKNIPCSSIAHTTPFDAMHEGRDAAVSDYGGSAADFLQ
jgi:hypothetical protein